jgi:hypothetical protein
MQQLIRTATSLFNQNITKTVLMLQEFGMSIKDMKPVMEKLSDDFTKAFMAGYEEGKRENKVDK